MDPIIVVILVVLYIVVPIMIARDYPRVRRAEQEKNSLEKEIQISDPQIDPTQGES